MTTKTTAIPAALLGLVGLGACATTGADQPSEAGVCRPSATAALVGKAAPDDTAILRKTESATVRRLAPGDIATKDYRADRVTVTITQGRVISASCG